MKEKTIITAEMQAYFTDLTLSGLSSRAGPIKDNLQHEYSLTKQVNQLNMLNQKSNHAYYIDQISNTHYISQTNNINHLNYANILTMNDYIRGQFPNLYDMQLTIVQLNFLSMIAGSINAKRYLELGTLLGFSAAYISLHLASEARIDTIDHNLEFIEIAKSLNQTYNKDHCNKINYIHGDARIVLDALEGKYDMILIDADKANCLLYYEKSLNILAQNGIIIVDNILMRGEIINHKNQTKRVVAMREFNNFIAHDNRVNTSFIALGDGMAMIRKLN